LDHNQEKPSGQLRKMCRRLARADPPAWTRRVPVFTSHRRRSGRSAREKAPGSWPKTMDVVDRCCPAERPACDHPWRTFKGLPTGTNRTAVINSGSRAPISAGQPISDQGFPATTGTPSWLPGCCHCLMALDRRALMSVRVAACPAWRVPAWFRAPLRYAVKARYGQGSLRFLQQASCLLCVPGELHCLESLQRLAEQHSIVTGDA
jgi:hypothetical protein